MNYRRLTRSELEELEPQFVRFLAAQSIPADDWVKIKVTDEKRADLLIDQFSQMVYDDVLRRCEYLEQRGAQQLLTFRSGPDKLELRGLVVQGGEVDLRQNTSPSDLLAEIQRSGAKLRVLSAERLYRPDRATELFAMIERGAKIAKTSELFDVLDQVTPAPAPVSTPDHNQA